MLRAMTLSDISQLLAIETATQMAPWTEEVFKKCFQAASRGWVIEQAEGKVSGFILVLIQVNECHVLNLAVAPSQQRQGHGSRLLSHALTVAKRQGAEIAYLEVRCSNEHAIALYKKMNFKKIGERKNYYSTGEGYENAWVFAKILIAC